MTITIASESEQLTQDLTSVGGIGIMAFEIGHNIHELLALCRECGWVEQMMAQFLADSMVVLLWAYILIVYRQKQDIGVGLVNLGLATFLLPRSPRRTLNCSSRTRLPSKKFS